MTNTNEEPIQAINKLVAAAEMRDELRSEIKVVSHFVRHGETPEGAKSLEYIKILKERNGDPTVRDRLDFIEKTLRDTRHGTLKEAEAFLGKHFDVSLDDAAKSSDMQLLNTLGPLADLPTVDALLSAGLAEKTKTKSPAARQNRENVFGKFGMS